jgi:hypothetical protein
MSLPDRIVRVPSQIYLAIINMRGEEERSVQEKINPEYEYGLEVYPRNNTTMKSTNKHPQHLGIPKLANRTNQSGNPFPFNTSITTLFIHLFTFYPPPVTLSTILHIHHLLPLCIRLLGGIALTPIPQTQLHLLRIQVLRPNLRHLRQPAGLHAHGRYHVVHF